MYAFLCDFDVIRLLFDRSLMSSSNKSLLLFCDTERYDVVSANIFVYAFFAYTAYVVLGRSTSEKHTAGNLIHKKSS